MMVDPEVVVFEAVVKADQSLFQVESVTLDNLASFRPHPDRAVRAAKVLEGLGFKVRHIGTFSVSGEGPRGLWEQTFGTKVKRESRKLSEAHPELGDVKYWTHIENTPFAVPPALTGLVDRAYPQRPPIFFAESPIPPRVGYHHLRVPSDVAAVVRAAQVHKYRVTGAGVLVAMPDTGFYKHSFYKWHGYNYTATLAPDAIRVDRDEVGHGTAEAANIFACAPDIDFVGVKMGWNATLAFKTASDLHPAVMTNSWGYDLRDPDTGGPADTLPNFLRPLEAAVIEAVRERGITVCFSGGNGQYGFPGQMPEVIAVGGVFAHDVVDDVTDDFTIQASDYASSFDSLIYPGRHVPDLCGLVGMQPAGIYIMLPVEPGDDIDQGLGGGTFPGGDETAPDDGWAVISGTSAASPQVAGVCALLKQTQPGLSPDLVKAILRASAREVVLGNSFHGEPAGEGHDGATGAGLVDALAAYKLARSVAIRNIYSLPAPR
jgi:subtilisin family serine protease